MAAEVKAEPGATAGAAGEAAAGEAAAAEAGQLEASCACSQGEG